METIRAMQSQQKGLSDEKFRAAIDSVTVKPEKEQIKCLCAPLSKFPCNLMLFR